MTTTSVKDKLFKYASDYPDLVFNNEGYQILPREVVEEHKQPILELESILKSVVPSFVSFQNFKLRSNGDLVIRYQAYWSDSFIGVVYTPVKEFGGDKYDTIC